MPSDEVALRRDLARSCVILGVAGHDDSVFGHVSVRADGSDDYWMKGAGVGLEEVSTDDLLLVTLDGDVAEGSRRRHSEYPIHSEIYRMREDVGAVVHTHPPYGVAFGATGADLAPVSHEGSFFCPPGVTRFTDTSDLIVTAERGKAVATALGDRHAVLLRNHGVVVVGTDLQEATVAALLLEKACLAQLRLLALGDYAFSSAEDTVAKRGRMYARNSIEEIWDYYLRRCVNPA